MTTDTFLDKLEAEVLKEESPLYGYKIYDDVYIDIDTFPAIGVKEVSFGVLNTNRNAIVRKVTLILGVYLLRDSEVRRTIQTNKIIEVIGNIMKLGSAKSVDGKIDVFGAVLDDSEEGIVGLSVIEI